MGTRKNISFDHFNQTIEDLKRSLKEEQRKHHDDMSNLIRDLKNELIEQKDSNSKLCDKVAMLTKQVSMLKNNLSKTSILAESNAQYSRRNNLIIKNIPPVQEK